jgi:hypothetical protein
MKRKQIWQSSQSIMKRRPSYSPVCEAHFRTLQSVTRKQHDTVVVRYQGKALFVFKLQLPSTAFFAFFFSQTVLRH